MAAEFTAGEIKKAVSGELVRGEAGMGSTGVSTDTRRLGAGELFVPIAGPNFDGHDFLAGALAGGAGGCLAERGRAPEATGGKFAIEVEDTLEALGDLAAYHRGRFDLPVVAVTGSNGKTTCKEMIGAILAEGARVLKGEGNLNNFIGLPLQVLALEAGHERAVFEMGMNRAGEILRLASIAAPSVGVITGVAPAHLERLGSIEAVREAKGELLEVMGAGGVAVLPRDDLQCRILAERRLEQGGRVATFGLEAKNDVYATRVKMSPEGETSFLIHMGGDKVEVSLPGVGRHNVLNALAAATAAAQLGSPLGEIVRGLESVVLPAMRLGVESFHGGAHLLNDAYNANPASVRLAISTVRELKGAGRAFAILGDMKELGAYEKFAHMEIGRAAVRAGLDFLAGVGPMMRLAVNEAHRAGMPLDQADVFTTPEEAAAWANELILPGDWVLVKGSRSMEMERAAEALRD